VPFVAMLAPAASMDAKVWRRESFRMACLGRVFEPTRLISRGAHAKA
jgi:hypothetical protein